MLNNYKWNHHAGSSEDRKLQLVGLSTCSHCHSARQYLEEKGLTFDWILLDDLEPENKTQFKRDFKKQYGQRLLFPSLVINEEEVLVSFMKVHWDLSLE